MNNEFWPPTGIDEVHLFLRRGMPAEGNPLQHHSAFVRNVGYNFQYLQFLKYTLDTQLHFTVRTLTQKSFVLTGMSIVEAILWYLLKAAGKQRTTEWADLKRFENAEFELDGSRVRTITLVQRKLSAAEDQQMTLDAMIKKVEGKKLLGVEQQVYEDLAFLRKLRNKVHIHAVQGDKDTDWWKFSAKEVNLMKGVLCSIFHSPLFHPGKEHVDLLSFLVPPEPIEVIVLDL